MRLIDADKLERRIKDTFCTGCFHYSGVKCRACSIGDALDMIDSEETIDQQQSFVCHNDRCHLQSYGECHWIANWRECKNRV